MRHLLQVLLGLSLLAGCEPNGRSSDDDTSQETETDADTPDGSVTTTDDATTPGCYELATEVEVASTVQIEQSCAIWNSLDAFPGSAIVTKTGSTVTINFGAAVIFSGPLLGNSISLTYNHDHPFSDGCGWRASETMTGTLDPDTCAFALAYDYAEYVVQNNGGCATPCSANANVNLELEPVVIL